MTNFPDYGATFAHWRAGAAQPWQAYTCHDFVTGLADGRLPQKAFLHYLVQDYVFLVHFARAWALAIVKSTTLEEMKICAGMVEALANQEMSLHVSKCAAAGISEQTLFSATEEVENLAYTRYVLDAGLSGDFLDLVAALAPCVFGYGEIGARLTKITHADTPYGDWIAAYGSAEYQDLCRSVGAMIDNAVLCRLGEDPVGAARWPHIQSRFTRATELEVGFWSMGLRGA